MRRRLAESHPDAGSVIIAGSRLRRSCASQPFVLDVAVARSTAAAANLAAHPDDARQSLSLQPPNERSHNNECSMRWRCKDVGPAGAAGSVGAVGAAVVVARFGTRPVGANGGVGGSGGIVN